MSTRAATHEITPSATSAEVRRKLVDTLRLDLIGPNNDDPFAEEVLPESPTKWYLTGYLMPTDAPLEQRFDETSVEEIDAAVDAQGLDDATAPDRPAARRSLLPSSIGLSVLVPAGVKELKAVVEWGDDRYEGPGSEPGTEPEQLAAAGSPSPDGDAGAGAESSDATTTDMPPHKRPCWRRIPRSQTVLVTLPQPGDRAPTLDVPDSQGLQLLVTVRAADAAGMPVGTRAVSVFVVNARPADVELPYRSYAFQVRLALHCEAGFVARPDPRGGHVQQEWDQRVADLHYRDCFEFGVGHGVSAEACTDAGGRCGCVRTTWIAEAEVERVAPQRIPDVELGMEALGQIRDAADVRAKLSPLVAHYRGWIERQRGSLAGLSPAHRSTSGDSNTASTR